MSPAHPMTLVLYVSSQSVSSSPHSSFCSACALSSPFSTELDARDTPALFTSTSTCLSDLDTSCTSDSSEDLSVMSATTGIILPFGCASALPCVLTAVSRASLRLPVMSRERESGLTKLQIRLLTHKLLLRCSRKLGQSEIPQCSFYPWIKPSQYHEPYIEAGASSEGILRLLDLEAYLCQYLRL